MADEENEGYLSNGAMLVIGLAGLAVGANEAHKRGLIPGMGKPKAKRAPKTIDYEYQEMVVPAPRKATGGSRAKAKKPAGSTKKPAGSAKKSSPWQVFVSNRMPKYRSAGYSAGDAMKKIAAEWREKKG